MSTIVNHPYNSQTKLLFSISSKPGNSGTKLYNHFFRKKNINAFYISKALTDLTRFMMVARDMQIYGISVSMPFKTEVINYLDDLDENAKLTKSVNTILFQENRLIGYNTDIYGASKALERVIFSSALIYGSGSVTTSLFMAINKIIPKSKIFLTARSQKKGQLKANSLGIEFVSRPSQFDLIVNATPSGVEEDNQYLFELIKNARIVFDLNVLPRSFSALIQKSKNLKKETITGLEMYIHQFQKQFFLYFGEEIELRQIIGLIKSF